MSAERVTVFACDRCGRHVACLCWSGRSAVVLAHDHRQAVKRAARSDAGLASPVPTPNMAGRQRTAQAVSRPSLRETRRAA